MSRSRGAVAAGLAGLAGVAAVLWLSRDAAPTGPVALDDLEGPVAPGAVAPSVVAAPRFAAASELVPPRSPGPLVLAPHPSGTGPAAPPRDPGFCPEPGEARTAYPRPALASVLNERTDELVARARVFTGTESEGLRRALELLSEAGRGREAVQAAAAAPDRRARGFDYASAVAVAAGARALGRADGLGGEASSTEQVTARRDIDAIVAAGLRHAPDDPVVHVLAAHVAVRHGDVGVARSALADAFALDPEEPSVAFALGRALADTADEAGAFEALRVYVDAFPDDVEGGRLARRVELRRDLAADFASVASRGVTVRHHRSVSADAARETLLLTTRVLDEAARLLGVSRRPELSVVVYGSRGELRASTCVPGWAGGVYDGTLRLAAPTVARQSERERVIRHEGLHAALGAAVGSTPYWFNEGLAQRFAGERGRAQRESWERLGRSGLVIPFPSLDGSFLDIDDPADAGLAYHQSLAMVDLLAARRGERVFADAVTYLQEGGDARRLFDELAGARPLTSADLLEFIASE